jgi:signal transduction histidine kinase
MDSALLSQPSIDKIDQLNQQAWDIRIIDSNKAHELIMEAFQLSKATGYAKGEAEGLRTLGFCLIRLSKHDEAYARLNEALAIFESLDDLKGKATVFQYFGIIQRTRGDFAASLESIFQALALSKQTGFTEHESTNYYQLGVTYWHLGNFEKALDNLFKSLEISRSIDFSLMVGYAINVIGSIYFGTGDYAKALEYYQQGLTIRRQSGDKWGEAGSLDNIGSTYLKLGDWKQAIDFCKQSLAINQSTGDKKGQANALLHLAEVYAQANDKQQAADFCYESLQIRRGIGDKKGEAEILLFLAELQRAHFKEEEKESLFEGLFKAMKIAEDIKAIDLLAKMHGALYESYKLCENHAEALKHLEFQIDIEKELHKDAINQKVLNLEITHRAEEAKKEAEIFRLRNVELAGLYEESKKQKEEIEQQKKIAENSLTELKAAQQQLIQSEKMASLGELTAGIAHEIQNPLNFVNNFSEVNTELIEELEQEAGKGNIDEVKSIANDIKENEQKINLHGKRADAIVKGMLQHSRLSTGQKEPTDINVLADEYLRLCYHGLRAKDKAFNAAIKTDFDNTIGKINIIPQDIGRVVLNLLTNAFYVVNQKKRLNIEGYEPIVSVSTKKLGNKISIIVKDNGNGIPQKVLDKIFQPFFTTKPTGEGTGLGLSLSYDIIKAHGGEIKVETKEGEGSEFVIQLPIV